MFEPDPDCRPDDDGPSRRVPKRLDDARRDLAGAAWPVARNVARAFARRHGLERLADDLCGLAGESLCRAAASYDPTAGSKWRSWWLTRVRYDLLDACRAEVPMGYRNAVHSTAPRVDRLADLSGHQAGGRGDGHSDRDGPDPIDPNSQPVGWEVEYEDEVLVLSRQLPGMYGDYFRLLCLECRGGVMPGSAARAMGRCRTRGSQLNRQCLARVRGWAIDHDVFGLRLVPDVPGGRMP